MTSPLTIERLSQIRHVEGGLIDFWDEAEAEAETEDQCGARAIINQIHQITISPTGREEDEIAPTPTVCEALVTLLQNTEALIGHLPSGDVSAFYGELSVTWRSGDRMVSVFFDPTGSALHHGCLTKEGVGGYLTEELTAGALAAKLYESHEALVLAAKAKLADCRARGDCSDAALLPGEFCSNECVALDAALRNAGVQP